MEVVEIPLIEIDNTDRARTDLGDLENLKGAINAHGLYQPVTVRTHPDETSTYKYKLVAGGRRLLAFQHLAIEHPKKFAKIPAIIRNDTDDLTALEIEALENIARKDFTWQERIKQVHRLDQIMQKKGKKKKDNEPAKYWSQKDTAKLIGTSSALVSRQLNLWKIMEAMPEVAKLDTEDKAVMVARKIIEQNEIKTAAAKRREFLQQDEPEGEPPSEDNPAEIKDLAKERYKRLAGKLLKIADSNFRVGNAFDGLDEMYELIQSGTVPPIALCEVDPPYGINIIDQKKGEGQGRDAYNEIPQETYANWTGELAKRLYQVLPKDCHIVYWFAYEWYETVRSALTDAGFIVDTIPCVWIKASGQTNDPEHYLARAHEPFFHARKGNPLIRKRGRSNVFSAENITLKNKFHPTQRPLNLMIDILETFTFPGQIVMSPFLGSGTTLLAAYRNGNLAFGWELSKEYKEGFMRAVQDDLTWHLNKELEQTKEDGNGNVAAEAK